VQAPKEVEYAKCEDRNLLTQKSLQIIILDVAGRSDGPFIFYTPPFRYQVNGLKKCFGAILMLVLVRISILFP